MTVKQLGRLLKATLAGEGGLEIRGVAALEAAAPDDLAFAENDRALERAPASRAGCILIAAGAAPALAARLEGRTTLAVAHPKLAFIRAAEALRPRDRGAAPVHPTAVIAPSAELGRDVSVGPQVVIERGAKVGARTRLGAGTVLGEGVEVGEDCVLYPRVAVYPGARIGNRVVLHAGVVIGSDGFGYVFAEGRHHKFPQLGGVIIEDDVEIGANSTVDRGSLGTTVIGQGTKIDNLVQVAHNVRIGRHTLIAAQSGISGSAEIGDQVVMAGQVGVGEKARIEDRVVVGGQAGVLPGKIVRQGSIVWGTPSRPLAEMKKISACLAILPRLAGKVRSLNARTIQSPVAGRGRG